MLLAQAADGNEGLYALSLTFVIVLIFLFLVRLMDPNEKEPLWAVGTALGVGLFVGIPFYLLVDSTLLELDLVRGTLALQVGTFVLIALVIAILNGIGRARGWSEVSGVLDGIVYGTATGLGFATAGVFVGAVVMPEMELLPIGPWQQLWPLLLPALAQGLFGGIIGAGFGAAVDARGNGARVVYPLVGLIAGFAANLGYNYLRHGRANTDSGQAMQWIALLLPLAVILVVMFIAIARERRAITTELADEAHAGVVSEDEFRLLSNPAARRGAYMKRYFSGDFEGWSRLRSLHNRQVQLALAEARLRRETDPDRRAMLQAETDAVRASILELKAQQGATTTTAGV